MADEEKPAADEQTTEVAEAASPILTKPLKHLMISENSSAEEAIEAIAKNVQERASEIKSA